MNQNSLDAWHSIIDTLPQKRKEVLDALSAMGKGTTHDVADYMDKRINQVSCRMTELRREGFITEVGTDMSTGRKRAIMAPVGVLTARQQELEL